MIVATRLDCRCSICGCDMDYENRYGREACCCSKDCWQEFDWRFTLSILGKPYRPRQTVPALTPGDAEQP